jgi:hypothetical protein
MKIVSLNEGCAWNLRFLDREEEIIYPWTKRGLWLVNKSEQ